jgi:hypothetical protein
MCLAVYCDAPSARAASRRVGKGRKGAISYHRARVARGGGFAGQWGNRLAVDMGLPELAEEVVPQQL